MITIKTDRIKAIYTRTNKRVPWQYAEYCGRWHTEEEAIEQAKEIMGNIPFQYMIRDMETDECTKGEIK